MKTRDSERWGEPTDETFLDVPWGRVGRFLYVCTSVCSEVTLLMLFFALHYPGEWAMLGHNKLKVWRKGKPEELEEEAQPEEDISVHLNSEHSDGISEVVPLTGIEGEGEGVQGLHPDEGGVLSTQSPHTEDIASEAQPGAALEEQQESVAEAVIGCDETIPKTGPFVIVEPSSPDQEVETVDTQQVGVSEENNPRKPLASAISLANEKAS